MLKFITKKSQHVSAERLKLQKELFAFNRTGCHGFPHSPTALAWDPTLQLFAIGTKTGSLRVYGAPGVAYVAEHEENGAVVELHFVPNQGRLISLCEDNSLHLWEINSTEDTSVLQHVQQCEVDAKLRKIFTCCVQTTGEHLYIGTECGNIHLLDIKTFQMTDTIIYQDLVTQNVPEDYKINPGGVEAIAMHPKDPNKMVIGYSRGLIVLWDNETLNAEQTYIASKDLHSISWHGSGTKFMSAHNDCSYIVWDTKDSETPLDSVEQCYGPYPCKAITKILWKNVKGRDNYIIFSGGMPRANYGDKHTVSVKHGDKSRVFDFTSKVIDFFTVDDSSDGSDYAEPQALVVLAEEELVAIDLVTEGWPAYALPCLSSLHASAITCSNHFSNVSQNVWEQLLQYGQKQVEACSSRPWPVTGGKSTSEERKQHDLLVTGHEDGSVRFWDTSGSTLRQLYILRTAHLFSGGDGISTCQQDDDEEWLHFAKVGTFDPYSDDPRLAVKKVLFCVQTGHLAVAGTAGQVVCFSLCSQESESTPEVVQLNFVGDRDSFVWKGHDPLQAKTEAVKCTEGFQANLIVQLAPPAGVTALALNSQWGLLAAGTAHGFGLVDYTQKKVVASKCTLNTNDLAASGDTMSRRKSFKKSLRESFRRLRKGRSQRGRKDKSTVKSPENRRPRRGENVEEGPASPGSRQEVGVDPGSPAVDAKPVERQVEARSSDDALSSMVRCLSLTSSFVISSVNTTPTLWVGTNSGAIFVYTITFPPRDKRESNPVQSVLGKEIHLKHKAPVISIHIIDARGYPVSDPFEAEPKGLEYPQRVLICSEEQFKVFTLPSLKPYGKLKITAHEGSRLRKVAVGRFPSRSDAQHEEFCLMVLTNQGDVGVYSLPELRRQLLVAGCLRREDINGISSLVFSKNGDGFHLNSPCELERFSLSAKHINAPRCIVELPEGARPGPEAAPEVSVAVEEKAEKSEAPLEDVLVIKEETTAVEAAPREIEAVVEKAVDCVTAPSPTKDIEIEDDKGGPDSPPDSGIGSIVITKNESNFTSTTTTIGDLKSLELDDLPAMDQDSLNEAFRDCKIEVVREKRTVVVVREESQTIANG
ncbi:lethal(2) giant larvae protein homolog 1-like isoform X2 [Ornithodoros turicata]